MQALEASQRGHPGSKELLEELMRAYGAQASLHGSMLVTTSLGKPEAALPLRRKQLAIAQQLSEMAPGDPDAQRALASALVAMGDQLLMMGSGCA